MGGGGLRVQPYILKAPRLQTLGAELLNFTTDWFLVGDGGMGFWDYYRGP